jgi:hypothetical protein
MRLVHSAPINYLVNRLTAFSAVIACCAFWFSLQTNALGNSPPFTLEKHVTSPEFVQIAIRDLTAKAKTLVRYNAGQYMEQTEIFSSSNPRTKQQKLINNTQSTVEVMRTDIIETPNGGRLVRLTFGPPQH